MKTFDYLKDILKERPAHVTLLDPDPIKLKDLEYKIKTLEKFGTDAFLIGGSSNIDQTFLAETIQKIKKISKLPVILFPGGVNGVSKYADTLLFMSLMNSKDPYFITGAQAKGSLLVKKLGIETIPMGYIIIEPGMKVGEVGKADLIRRYEMERAVGYALAAEYMGMDMVYIEAGSGADKPVPINMITEIKKHVSIPVIVGGGIRTPEQAKDLLNAGTDIIDTGTITEENFETIEGIIKTVREHKR
jgi:phosphoglycerol geranylgeranyltransferase